MKPALFILLLTAFLAGGCSTSRNLSYDRLKTRHHVARINQIDNTVVQINFPTQVRAVINNDYLELYYPRRQDAEKRVLLMSVHADDILDIFVSKSNNPNAIQIEWALWFILSELLWWF